jgi:hypothetical protein
LRRALSFFVHRHAGLPAVVIGGGISRSSQVARCPPPGDAIYVSANRHGCEIARCDYIACLDVIEPELRPLGVPIATTRDFGEIRIFAQRVNQSGMLGAYLAWAMGCSPILLCGMDCWVGGTYESDPAAKSSGARVATIQHIKRWQTAGSIMAGADVRSLGGPLVEHGVFPLHDPARPAGPIAQADVLYRDVGGWVVEFLSDVRLRSYSYSQGDIAEISENEVRRLRQERQVRVLGYVRSNPDLRHQTRPARRIGK